MAGKEGGPRKKREPWDQPYVPDTPASYTEQKTLEHRISVAEKGSGSTLPTQVTYAMANHQGFTDDRQLYKAAKLIARKTALPPTYLFKPDKTTTLDDYKVNGTTISATDARRLMKPYEAAIIAGMLKGYLSKVPTQVVGETEGGVTRHKFGAVTIPGHPEITPQRIAQVIRSFAPVQGDDWTFSDLMAAAINVAGTKGLKVSAFEKNLRMVMQAPAIDPRAGVAPARAIALAHAATAAGVTFQKPADVLAFIVPDFAPAVAVMSDIQKLTQNPNGPIPPEYSKGDPSSPDYDPTSLEAQIVLNRSLGPSAVAIQVAAVRGVSPDIASVVQGVVRQLGDNEGDYVKTAKEIEHNIQIQKDAFKNSLLAKGIGDILGPINFVYQRTVGEFEVAAGGITKMQGASGQGGFSETWQDMRDLFFGRATANTSRSLENVPAWEKAGVDLVAGWYLSPDVIALRALSEAKAARSLATGAEDFLSEAERLVNEPLARIGQYKDVTIGEAYVKAIVDNPGDEARAVLNLNEMMTKTFGTDGLHPLTVSFIYRTVPAEIAAGRSIENVVADVNAIIAEPFGVTAETGSLLDRLQSYRENIDTFTAQSLPGALSDVGSYTTDAANYASAESRRAFGLLNDWDYYMGTIRAGVPLETEVPKLANPASRALLGGLDGMADTAIGRQVRAAFNAAPEVRGGTSELSIEAGKALPEDVRSYLQRFNSFSLNTISKSEIDQKVAEVAQFINPGLNIGGVPREALFASWRADLENEMVSRLFGEYNAPPEFVDKVLATMKSKYPSVDPRVAYGYTTENTDVSGITPSEVPIRQPIGVTQLRNDYKMLDPIALRHGIDEAMGTFREVRDAMMRTLHLTTPEAKAAALPIRKIIDSFGELVTKDLFLRAWKPLNVIRPAYIMRVVATEEQLRFMATAGLLNRIKAGPILSKLTDIAGDTAEEFHFLVDGEDMALPGLPALYRSSEFPEFTNSGLKWGMPQDASGPLGRFLSGRAANIGAVGRDDAHFYEAWLHDLTMQGAQDPILRRYLEDVAGGVGRDESVQRTYDFLASKDGRGLAQRLMQGASIQQGERGIRYTNEALHLQVERGVDVMRSYTSANPDLARAALNGADPLTVDMLKTTFDDYKPWFVHGPELEMTSATNGPLKTALRRYSQFILEDSTNNLTRSPYGKLWYDKMLKSLIDLHGGEVSADQLAVIEKTSRQFAAEQVNRIMFDFTRQNRIGESLGAVFPFMQPFGEQFVVWSRIINQNPMLLPHIIQMGRAGTDSGFIHKDENGQYVVPLSNWFAASNMLGAVYGIGGWKLSAPASSFNIFLQSTFPVPTGGLAGDFPVPTPGLNPEFTWVMQNWLKWKGKGAVPGGLDVNPAVRARLSSWLNQYGDTNALTLLPSYLRNWAIGINPSLDQGSFDRLAAEFENLQAFRGQPVNPAQAEMHAREMYAFKGLFSFIFPTPPRIEFPDASLEQEWRDLRGRYDTQTASKMFLDRHGEQYRIFTIGKTALDPESPLTISLPPNEGVERLLSGKGARQFIDSHPRWAWAIIPDEMRNGTFDPGAYFDFLSRGWTTTLTPEQRLEKSQTQSGWDAYFAAKENFTAWQEAHPNLGEGDASYEAARLEFTKATQTIEANNHPFALAYNSFTQPNPVDWRRQMAEVRSLVKDPLFSQTDTGQALGRWVVLYDDVRQKMADANIKSLYDVSGAPTRAAAFLGLDTEYETGLKQITAEHPNFQLPLDTILAPALQGVTTTYDKTIKNLSDQALGSITNWENRWEKIKDIPTDSIDKFKGYDSYLTRRDWIEHAYKDFGDNKATNPVLLWWANKNTYEQSQYAASISALPYAWLSRFDRTVVLGDKTNTRAEQYWAAYNKARNEISKKAAFDPNFTQSDAYKRLDHEVSVWAHKDPAFAAQVKAANTWAYSFSKVVPDLFASGSVTSKYWQNVLAASAVVHRYADQHQMVGESDYDPHKRALYNDIKYKKIEHYIQTMFADSPQFKEEWDYLEHLNGSDHLLDIFIPVSNYPIGGH